VRVKGAEIHASLSPPIYYILLPTPFLRTTYSPGVLGNRLRNTGLGWARLELNGLLPHMFLMCLVEQKSGNSRS
jgi:hypothetical protein